MLLIETKQVRLHVGGLPGKISEKDIEDRFRSFGTVQKVDLIPHPFEGKVSFKMKKLICCLYFIEGACRGFAYVNLETSDAQLSKCMNVLNGCSWKGGKLHISFAKPNKFRTLEDGRIVVIKAEEEEKKVKKRIPKKKRRLVRHASDSSLVNDKNVDKRKGWRRGRYGRAIACLRIRRPNRQMLIIDPSHYKNNLEKLFGSVKPKPISQLCWTVTDIKNIDEIFEAYENDSEAEEHEEFNEDISMEIDEVNDDELECVEITPVVHSEPEKQENSEYLVAESTQDCEVAQETVDEPYQEDSMQDFSTAALNETRDMEVDTEPVVEEEEASTVIVNTFDSLITEDPKSEDSKSPAAVAPAVKPETKFEVNVNWSSLFAPSSTESSSLFGDKVTLTTESSGFSLNSLIEKSAKIKNVSMDELFKKPEIPSVSEDIPKPSESADQIQPTTNVKKVHNYAHLFGDLNRITPTTAVRFGMHLSRKEDLLHEWRIERVELKEDFKKRLAEGKRRNRRGGGNKSSV